MTPTTSSSLILSTLTSCSTSSALSPAAVERQDNEATALHLQDQKTSPYLICRKVSSFQWKKFPGPRLSFVNCTNPPLAALQTTFNHILSYWGIWFFTSSFCLTFLALGLLLALIHSLLSWQLPLVARFLLLFSHSLGVGTGPAWGQRLWTPTWCAWNRERNCLYVNVDLRTMGKRGR